MRYLQKKMFQEGQIVVLSTELITPAEQLAGSVQEKCILKERSLNIFTVKNCKFTFWFHTDNFIQEKVHI